MTWSIVLNVAGVSLLIGGVLYALFKYLSYLEDLVASYMYPHVRTQVKKILIEAGEEVNPNIDPEYVENSWTLDAATSYIVEHRVKSWPVKDLATIVKAHRRGLEQDINQQMQILATHEAKYYSLDLYVWFLTNTDNMEQYLEETEIIGGIKMEDS